MQTCNLSLLALHTVSKALALAPLFSPAFSDLAECCLLEGGLTSCSEARIPGNGEHESFPPKKGVWPERLGKLRLCVRCCRIGWEGWCGCLLGWAWERFLRSRDLLLNRSRADVMVIEELKEISWGFCSYGLKQKNLGVHWGQLRSKRMSSFGYKESHC